MAWAASLPLATAAVSGAQATPGPYLFAMAIYLIGGAICHQRDERSFHLWARQLPVCARCTGIYVGAALAAIALSVPALRRHGPRHHRRAVLIWAALPAAASLVYEWTTGITPGNGLRAATGVLLGAAVASLVIYEVN